MPLSLVWLGFFFLTIVLLRRRVYVPSRLALSLWLGLSVIGNPWFGSLLSAWVDITPHPQTTEGRFDAALLLGGSTYTDVHGTPRFNQSGDRILTAARLYGSGRVPIIVTYAPPWKYENDRVHHGDSSETVRIMIDMGVPRSAMIWDWGPFNTRAEVVRFAELARQRGWRELAVISTSSHLHRALYYGKEVELNLVPIPASPNVSTRRWPSALDLIPNGPTVAQSTILAWEALGLLAAMTMGW